MVELLGLRHVAGHGWSVGGRSSTAAEVEESHRRGRRRQAAGTSASTSTGTGTGTGTAHAALPPLPPRARADTSGVSPRSLSSASRSFSPASATWCKPAPPPKHDQSTAACGGRRTGGKEVRT